LSGLEERIKSQGGGKAARGPKHHPARHRCITGLRGRTRGEKKKNVDHREGGGTVHAGRGVLEKENEAQRGAGNKGH